MNKRYLLTLVILVLTLPACVGAPSRMSNFYLLSPDPGQPVAGRVAASAPLVLGLGPVVLPEVYDRPQIVTRAEGNRIELAEYDRWGGDLNKELTRTLARNLMTRLNTDSVALYPWPGRYRPDFQVTIRFFRLDGVLDQSAVLDGAWHLLDGERGCERLARSFRIEQPVTAGGYAGLVEAISLAVARLSQEIAEQVDTATPGCD